MTISCQTSIFTDWGIPSTTLSACNSTHFEELKWKQQHSDSCEAPGKAVPTRIPTKKNYIMSSIPGRLIGKPSPKGEQSTLTLSLAMLFFLISKQMGKQSNSLFIALMKLLFRLLIDYLGGSTVSYFLRIWGFISSLFIWSYSLLNSLHNARRFHWNKSSGKTATHIKIFI